MFIFQQVCCYCNRISAIDWTWRVYVYVVGRWSSCRRFGGHRSISNLRSANTKVCNLIWLQHRIYLLALRNYKTRAHRLRRRQLTACISAANLYSAGGRQRKNLHHNIT